MTVNAKTKLTIAFALGLASGAVSTYLAEHSTSSGFSSAWIELATDGSGFAWQTEALFGVDIPLPEVSKPQGRVKFLDRSEQGKPEIQLGYVVKAAVKPLDVSTIPSKYRQPRKVGEIEIDALTEVVYEGHLEFTLKDSDGFTLLTASSEKIYIYSGQENLFQGTVPQAITRGIAKRTSTVLVSLTADKCTSCR